ncbi:GAF and ANTAR domain-containing protein [Streptomyces kanamyceticus]|uniref:ANTAR domain-containing protein n=1 Tax=Streptomyces kanamyceticus TaxID=1967 RepID=A0A5J6GGH8_STRKN|nr:GAF and ANTAR domain-containing protein [Streptomyces kanamyceticus]QEU93005.1 ANTAR domain-containing protein [Streptomyces kanamyceticus]
MRPEQQLADVFVALARGTEESPDVPGTLSVLAHHSPRLLDARAASVVYVPGGREAPQVVGSDPEVTLLERDAVERGEGPAHDCLRQGRCPRLVGLADPAARWRWPHYAPQAVALGYNRVAVHPLRGRGGVTGALLLLSSEAAGPVDPDMLELGQSMADFTAVTLERVREAEQSRTLTVQLERALISRVIIEQAKGVLAAHRRVTMDEAFDVLRKYARSRRRQLSEVSREVVEGQADPELTGPIEG